jgi:OOP family OmpA-OmpF porin
MIKKLVALLVFLFVFVFSTTAFAQDSVRPSTAGKAIITPFFGSYIFEHTQDLDGALYYGLRAGYNFTDHLRAEGLFGYIPTKSDARGFDGDYVSVYRYGVEAQYMFMPKYFIVPFFALGAGGVQINDASGINDKNKFITVDYGFGYNILLFSNVSLRVDIRHGLFWDNEKPHSNLESTIGMSFMF